MSCRQMLAKFGIVVLLGLNIAAYFYLWPRKEVTTNVADESNPVAVLPPKPKDFPNAAAKQAKPVEPPVKDTMADPLVRLREHIKTEAPSDGFVVPIPATVERIEVPPPLPRAEAPLEPVPPSALPALQGKPIDDVAVTSPLAPKQVEDPWIIVPHALEANNTLIVAKLRFAPPNQAVEFEIRCDRYEETATRGIDAIGNVTFVGAGIKGSCRRLSISSDNARLVFTGQVTIASLFTDKMPRSALTGERIVWELPSVGVEVNSAEFRPAGLLLPAKGALGPPK